MKKRVPLSQIMSKELVMLNPKQTLYDAEKLFEMYGIRHIPVTEGKRLLGVLSKSDMLRISYSELADDEQSVDSMVYDAFTIPQVMTKNLITLKPDDTIKEAAEVFSQNSFHSIPVVENGELMGMITTTDLINYFLEQY